MRPTRKERGYRLKIKWKTRLRVLLRDHQRCRYCGKELDPFAPRHTRRTATLDHVIPVSKGGDQSLINLVAACEPCNIKKMDRTPAQAGMCLLPMPGRMHLRVLSKKEENPRWTFGTRIDTTMRSVARISMPPQRCEMTLTSTWECCAVPSPAATTPRGTSHGDEA